MSDGAPARPAPGRPTSDIAALLDGARTVFAAQGFHGTTMADVARSTKVSKPTLYAHFDSKDALYGAAITREASRLQEHLFAAYDRAADRPLGEQVTLGFGALFDYAAAQPEGFSLLFTSSDPTPGADARRELLVELRRRVAESVTSYTEHRELPFGRHADLVAAWLVELAIETARHQMQTDATDLETARDLSIAFALAGLRHMEGGDTPPDGNQRRERHRP